MNRVSDVVLASVALIVAVLPIAIISVLVKLTSKGPVLHWSKRIGRNNRIFWMPKFRTMRTDTPQVATHLLTDSARWITPVGRILRKTSLDELPQIWNILTGEMAVVGPRPALFNQDDLVSLRTERGVHTVRPGLTGYAQVNGRDNLSISQKAELDAWYCQNRSLWLDIAILFQTVFKVSTGADVVGTQRNRTSVVVRHGLPRGR